MHTSGASDECSELPTTTEYDQPLVNQSDVFPQLLRQQHHFKNIIRENVLVPYPKDNPGEEIEILQEQLCGGPQDRIIHSSPYSPVLPHFPRVPTRILGQVNLITQRQIYEFVNSPDNDIDLSYLIYHENPNKCHFFNDTGVLEHNQLAKCRHWTVKHSSLVATNHIESYKGHA